MLYKRGDTSFNDFRKIQNNTLWYICTITTYPYTYWWKRSRLILTPRNSFTLCVQYCWMSLGKYKAYSITYVSRSRTTHPLGQAESTMTSTTGLVTSKQKSTCWPLSFFISMKVCVTLSSELRKTSCLNKSRYGPSEFKSTHHQDF